MQHVDSEVSFVASDRTVVEEAEVQSGALGSGVEFLVRLDPRDATSRSATSTGACDLCTWLILAMSRDGSCVVR